jgi:hypothetical protein
MHPSNSTQPAPDLREMVRLHVDIIRDNDLHYDGRYTFLFVCCIVAVGIVLILDGLGLVASDRGPKEQPGCWAKIHTIT